MHFSFQLSSASSVLVLSSLYSTTSSFCPSTPRASIYSLSLFDPRSDSPALFFFFLGVGNLRIPFLRSLFWSSKPPRTLFFDWPLGLVPLDTIPFLDHHHPRATRPPLLDLSTSVFLPAASLHSSRHDGARPDRKQVELDISHRPVHAAPNSIVIHHLPTEHVPPSASPGWLCTYSSEGRQARAYSVGEIPRSSRPPCTRSVLPKVPATLSEVQSMIAKPSDSSVWFL